MQIVEIPIESKKVKKKKYSAKTERAAEGFLSEIDLRIEQLDDEQKAHILDHFKTKRSIKWAIVVMIISFIINLSLIFWYKHIFNEIADFVLGPDTNVEVIEEDGSTSYKKITEKELETLRSYGSVCAMTASTMTMLFFTAFTALISSIVWVFRIRKQGEIFRAFLPALKTVPPATNSKFVTH